MTSSTRTSDFIALPPAPSARSRRHDGGAGAARAVGGVAALVLGLVPYRNVSVPQRPRLPAGSVTPLL